MAKRKSEQEKKRYLLVLELAALCDEMGLAMRCANTYWVGETGRMTPHMEQVMADFADWARRANEAGIP